MIWPGPSEIVTTLFVQGIAVKKEDQNQGIGKKLLNHIEEYAKAKGISGVGLQSGDKRTSAHIFYEHNGYTRSNYFYKNF
jgi:GNAT superfamily N-acetyltransferase